MGKVTYLSDNGNVISLETISNCCARLEASINGVISTLDYVVSHTALEAEQYNQMAMIKQALKQNVAELYYLWPADPPLEEPIGKLHETKPGALTPELETLLREAEAGQEEDKT